MTQKNEWDWHIRKVRDWLLSQSWCPPHTCDFESNCKLCALIDSLPLMKAMPIDYAKKVSEIREALEINNDTQRTQRKD